MRNVKPIEREDSSGIGREPPDLAIVHAHGEEPLPVRLKEKGRFDDRGVDLFSFVS